MRFLIVFLFTVSSFFAAPLFSEELSHSLFEDSETTASVTVKRGDLVHTALLSTPGTSDLEAAFAGLADQISTIAESFGTSTDRVAKLNLYLDSEKQSELDRLRALVQSHWEKGKAPALTLIPSKLPDGGLLAGDAVIATNAPASPWMKPSKPVAAIMPSHRDIIYVSGRAASGELATATAQTMIQIFDVLEHLGSTPQDVVQVKAFLQPIEQWKVVEAEIAKSFGGSSPPVVYVEWISGSRATEIEVIAAAPVHEENSGTVSYFTPPGEKKSPVYSRVARIHSDRVIYLSELRSGGSETETRALFSQLKNHARAAGTDLRHFAKATYYVTSPEASASLGTVRPTLYDPPRPPAASKVLIRSIDHGTNELLIDMVAAPAGK